MEITNFEKPKKLSLTEESYYQQKLCCVFKNKYMQKFETMIGKLKIIGELQPYPRSFTQ